MDKKSYKKPDRIPFYDKMITPLVETMLPMKHLFIYFFPKLMLVLLYNAVNSDSVKQK